MSLFPPPTNDQYHGSLGAAHFLFALSIVTIIPGCIHTFLPDGGAGVIAGIDLSQCRTVVIALFAWAGATQIVFGIVMLLVARRYRNFVPLVLALVAVERTLHALNGWIFKGSGTGHHPPEHYAVLVGVPLTLVALMYSLRPRS